MTVKLWPVWLYAGLLITGCVVLGDRGDEITSTRARDLIHRNVLLGDDQYPIDDPRAYQYGNVHVDGASGGMLYRFASNSDALEWIVESHRLQETTIETGDQLPIDFLDDRPRWWDPWKANPSAFYIFAEEFATGGKRQFILVFDSSAGVIYAVEHYSDMPGI